MGSKHNLFNEGYIGKNACPPDTSIYNATDYDWHLRLGHVFKQYFHDIGLLSDAYMDGGIRVCDLSDQ